MQFFFKKPSSTLQREEGREVNELFLSEITMLHHFSPSSAKANLSLQTQKTIYFSFEKKTLDMSIWKFPCFLEALGKAFERGNISGWYQYSRDCREIFCAQLTFLVNLNAQHVFLAVAKKKMQSVHVIFFLSLFRERCFAFFSSPKWNRKAWPLAEMRMVPKETAYITKTLLVERVNFPCVQYRKEDPWVRGTIPGADIACLQKFALQFSWAPKKRRARKRKRFPFPFPLLATWNQWEKRTAEDIFLRVTLFPSFLLFLPLRRGNYHLLLVDPFKMCIVQILSC